MFREPPSQQVKKPRINFPEKISIKEKLKEQKEIPAIKETPKIDEYSDAERIKLVFVGDGSCGKTSALISYTTDNFNPDYTPTIFDSYESTIKKGEDTVKLELWDTAGQDEYKMLRQLSYPNTDVFLICFSMVDKNTFFNALNKWLKEVKENCPRSEVIFVGTKIDIIIDYQMQKELSSQVLDEEKVTKKITSMGYKFLMCSALTQKGLNAVFDSAIDTVLKRRKEKIDVKKAADTECQII